MDVPGVLFDEARVCWLTGLVVVLNSGRWFAPSFIPVHHWAHQLLHALDHTFALLCERGVLEHAIEGVRDIGTHMHASLPLALYKCMSFTSD